MKCIQCKTNNNLKDRNVNRGRCKNCGHPFIVEPTTMKDLKLTDSLLERVIINVSQENSLFFTEKQFHYRLNWKIRKQGTFDLKFIESGLSFLGRMFKRKSSTESQSIPPQSIFPSPHRLFIDLQNSLAILKRWQGVNPLSKLLPSPSSRSSVRKNRLLSAEILSYSFDRAIICDKAEIAQLLIANNFHFEHNCAILSLNGYPVEIFDTVRGMLRQNENLKVYALHDFSPQGVRLVSILRNSPDWFRGTSTPVNDIGITARQIISFPKNFYICCTSESAAAAQRLPPNVCTTLTSEELNWLKQGNFVELESFIPLKLINILRRVLTTERADSLDSGSELFDETMLLFIDNDLEVEFNIFEVVDTFG